MRHTSIPRRSMLSSFVGNMFTSQPEDIKKTRRNFAAIGRYDGDTELEYIDRELDQTIRTFQIDNGLKQDGVMRPNGETENTLNRELRDFSNNDLQNTFDVRPALELSDRVGNLQRNKPEDVKQVQKELSRIKLLPENSLRNPSGILDGQTDQAIKAFQSIKSLSVDGMLSPRGETEKMFNDDAPTPDSDGEEPDTPPIPPRKPDPNIEAEIAQLEKEITELEIKKEPLGQQISSLGEKLAPLKVEQKQLSKDVEDMNLEWLNPFDGFMDVISGDN